MRYCVFALIFALTTFAGFAAEQTPPPGSLVKEYADIVKDLTTATEKAVQGGNEEQIRKCNFALFMASQGLIFAFAADLPKYANERSGTLEKLNSALVKNLRPMLAECQGGSA